MKPNEQSSPAQPGGHNGKATRRARMVSAVNPCRTVTRQLAEIKQSLVREFGVALGGQRGLLQSALNEAEAVAWQTPYPHLVFPVLAEEKASAMSRWAARQRSVRRASREISLTA